MNNIKSGFSNHLSANSMVRFKSEMKSKICRPKTKGIVHSALSILDFGNLFFNKA